MFQNRFKHGIFKISDLGIDTETSLQSVGKNILLIVA